MPEQIQAIIEAALLVAGQPLTIKNLQNLFPQDLQPSNNEIQAAFAAIRDRFANSGIELQEVASGFRFQAKAEMSPYLSKLWSERPARYSRAFLETLSIIAYKQPITRAEIEEIRGVAVSSHIVKALLEREWIKIIGFREVPGKPALFATTKTFLDHFNLKSLSDMPSLAEFKNIEEQAANLQVAMDIDQDDDSQTDDNIVEKAHEQMQAVAEMAEVDEVDEQAIEHEAQLMAG
jgi:segregation and condensation protein B